MMGAWYNIIKQQASSRFPRAYGFCESRKGAIKFIFSGVIAAGVNLLVLDIAYRVFNWPIFSAACLAFIVSFFISFSLQKFWTFREDSQERLPGQLFAYLLNGLLGLYLNARLMKLLVEDLSVWHIVAQLAVSALIALQNYLVYRFIFQKKHANSRE